MDHIILLWGKASRVLGIKNLTFFNSILVTRQGSPEPNLIYLIIDLIKLDKNKISIQIIEFYFHKIDKIKVMALISSY